MENPYSAPATTEAFVDEPNMPRILAGFWIRVLATIIDMIWLTILGVILGIAIYGIAYLESDKVVEGPADIFISHMLPLGIYVWFWMKKGATPGKLICGIRIITVDGSPLTIGKCLIRYIGYYISLFPLFVGYLWPLWDSKNQTWHDKMARTLVVKAR